MNRTLPERFPPLAEQLQRSFPHLGGKWQGSQWGPLTGNSRWSWTLPQGVLEVWGEASSAELQQLDLLVLLESQRKLAELGHLVAGLAHELANPLTAMSAHLAVLKAGGASVSDLEELVGRCNRLTQGLLGFARPARTPDAELDAALAEASRTTGVTFHRSGPSGLRAAIGPDELVQILVNLLANARHAGRVEVRVDESPEQLTLEVEDDGPGPIESVRERIFQPFVTTKPLGEGSGLGLHLSRLLARDRGGELEYLGGSRFRLQLRR